MSQIAKMFIRGSLAKVTAKNLTKEQLAEVNDACKMAWNDPNLQKAKIGFCAALGNTIKNEYRNIDCGLQEVRIIYWIASVDILFHRPKKLIKKILDATCKNCKTTAYHPCKNCENGLITVEGIKEKLECPNCMGTGNGNPAKDIACPSCGSKEKLQAPDIINMSISEAEKVFTEMTGKPVPERDKSIITNPVQRKKFYQTFLFNYLRQIINENKFHQSKTLTRIRQHADTATSMAVKSVLDNTKSIKYETGGNSYRLDTNLLPLDAIIRLNDIKNDMKGHGITITINEESISITIDNPMYNPVIDIDIVALARVHEISIDKFNDDDDKEGFHDHVEFNGQNVGHHHRAIEHNDVDLSDCVAIMEERLPQKGITVLKLIVDPPPEYIEQYGSGPARKAHISRFLGWSMKEVNQIIEMIKMQMYAIELIPDSKS